MRILSICKASTEIGLGHLIRSRAMAEAASARHEVRFIVIGGEMARKLLAGCGFPAKVVPDEAGLEEHVVGTFDAAFLDMLSLGEEPMAQVRRRARLCVSLCPIFDRMAEMDLLFSRTRYSHPASEKAGVERYLGLEYAVIRKECVRIATKEYKGVLSRSTLPIAISMGGGDAANKTRRFLKSLRTCRVPATFWVLVGEGYNHSYDALINTIERDRGHEIILAKTNMSMWHILRNCVLAILPGGVTTYEAAFAGLPSVNMLEARDQSFLIRELAEAGACIDAGLVSDANLRRLNLLVERLHRDRGALLRMHERAKPLIDGKGCERILRVTERALSGKGERKAGRAA
ncbi:MAG: hypothetical protein HY924_05245 [Elusimicrobia bacterium]|nr:hypothetical protein [Elusimicrobiota bacterium]